MLSHWKIDRIIATLILCIAFIVIGPTIPFIANNLLAATLCVLGIVMTMALIKKAWVDAGIALIISMTLLLSRLIFDIVPETVFLFRAMGILAFLFLHITLVLGPLSRLFKKTRPWSAHRRHIGVITFLLAFFHESLIMKQLFSFSLEKALMLPYVFFGIISFGILILLALTSWNRSQRNMNLTYWSVVHMLSLLIFMILSYYFLTTYTNPLTWHIVVIALCGALWLFFAPWGIAKKIHKRVNGWKQIHFLVYIAYLTTIVHVWSGRAQFQPAWVQLLFWICVLSVIGIHTAGWIRYFKNKKIRRKDK